MLNKRSSRFNMPPGGPMQPGGPMPMPPGGPMAMPPGGMPSGQFMNDPGFSQPHQPQSSFYPGYQNDRLHQEIRENRRRIDNLARRVGRIENYLQIRDSNEPNYHDDNYSF